MAATCYDESQEHLGPRGSDWLTLSGPGLSLLEDHVGFLRTRLRSKCKVGIWGWTTHCERGGGQREKGVSLSFGVRRAELHCSSCLLLIGVALHRSHGLDRSSFRIWKMAILGTV